MDAPVVLCVAQRPKTAQLIAEVLSRKQYKVGSVLRDAYLVIQTRPKQSVNPVFELCHYETGQQFVVTSANDQELVKIWFPPSCRQWQGSRLIELYDVPLEKKIQESQTQFISKLRQLCRNACKLELWTDQTELGETIAIDVADVCLK